MLPPKPTNAGLCMVLSGRDGGEVGSVSYGGCDLAWVVFVVQNTHTHLSSFWTGGLAANCMHTTGQLSYEWCHQKHRANRTSNRSRSRRESRFYCVSIFGIQYNKCTRTNKLNLWMDEGWALTQLNVSIRRYNNIYRQILWQTLETESFQTNHTGVLVCVWKAESARRAHPMHTEQCTRFIQCFNVCQTW